MNVRALILAEYRRQQGEPFAWGAADCLSFAADCAKAIIGRDPAADIRDRYKSEATAKRVMAEQGWRSMRDVAASMFKAIPVAFARSGDWAVVENPDGSDGLGVVSGERIVVRTREAFGLVPLTAAVAAYRVE